MNELFKLYCNITKFLVRKCYLCLYTRHLHGYEHMCYHFCLIYIGGELRGGRPARSRACSSAMIISRFAMNCAQTIHTWKLGTLKWHLLAITTQQNQTSSLVMSSNKVVDTTYLCLGLVHSISSYDQHPVDLHKRSKYTINTGLRAHILHGGRFLTWRATQF